jgi:RimJ/RimL family protein N-acetyltransferase
MPKWQGRGFATEAVEKFIEVLGTKPLELDIECDPRNTGSVNMAKRLGFEKISFRERAYESKGEWVDSLVFRKVVNDCRDSQKVPAHLHTKRYVGLS